MWIKTKEDLPVFSQLYISSLSDQELSLILEDIEISRAGCGGVYSRNRGIMQLVSDYKVSNLVWSNTPVEGKKVWCLDFSKEVTKPVTFEEAFDTFK